MRDPLAPPGSPPGLPIRKRRISRTVHLYIARETLKSLFLVMVIFEAVLGSIFAFGAVRNYGLDLGLLLPVLGPAFAAYLNPAMPVSLLFSIPLVYGRLIADREMAALKGFGFSHLELALAPAVLGSLLAGVVLVLNLYLLPGLRFTRDNLGQLILERLRSVEEGSNLNFPLGSNTLWIELIEGQKRKGIFIGAEGGQSLGLRGLQGNMTQSDVLSRSYPLFLYAQEGEVVRGSGPGGKLFIELRGVSVYYDTEYRDKAVSTDLRDFKQRVDFSRLELPVTIEEQNLNVKEMSEPALRRRIGRTGQELQIAKGKPEEASLRNEYFMAVTEYHRRISGALVALSFSLAAAMLALFLNSPNRLLPVFVSLMVAAPVYYVLDLLGNTWARVGLLPWFTCQLGNLGLILFTAGLGLAARRRTLW